MGLSHRGYYWGLVLAVLVSSCENAFGEAVTVSTASSTLSKDSTILFESKTYGEGGMDRDQDLSETKILSETKDLPNPHAGNKARNTKAAVQELCKFSPLAETPLSVGLDLGGLELLDEGQAVSVFEEHGDPIAVPSGNSSRGDLIRKENSARKPRRSFVTALNYVCRKVCESAESDAKQSSVGAHTQSKDAKTEMLKMRGKMLKKGKTKMCTEVCPLIQQV